MTRVARPFGFGDTMQKEVILSVSSNANFITSKFPKYIIGANSIIIEPQEGPEVPSLKEIVAKETAMMIERHQRVSVRDLAKKFENGLATATKLSDEAKWREVANLDKYVILKKLKDVLESMRGHVAGRNRDDTGDAISMVEALAVLLTQREGELLHEKVEVERLASFLKKASEDAKKVVGEERAYARAEIERAKTAVQRVENALHEQEQISRSKEKQDLKELMREVQGARRVKMLHKPSRVMDMEHELQVLRILVAEKSVHSIQLRKELAMYRKLTDKSRLYEFEGSESLGSCLHIIPVMEAILDISNFSIQWYRIQPEGNKKKLISGATKSMYAPEPLDVGWILQAEISSSDERLMVRTTGPIDPAAGLGSYVEALVRKSETEFNVVIVQMNRNDHLSNSLYVFRVRKTWIELCKGKTTKAKEYFSNSMQLCGVRGGGNAAAQALFWQVNRSLSFTLAFESSRERNAAIMLARRFAFDCNVVLAGPGDHAPAETR